MDPVTAAALIGAGSALIGGIQRNKSAKAATAKQMAYQTQMSNTSYQRGMADMKKAGLNPMLAYQKGGASTPTGSTYNPENVGAAASQSAATMANAQSTVIKSKLDALDLKAFKKIGMGPQYANTPPTNKIGNKIIEKTGEVVTNAKEKADQNKKYNKDNPHSRHYNNLAPYNTKYTKKKAINPTGSRGSGNFNPPRTR